MVVVVAAHAVVLRVTSGCLVHEGLPLRQAPHSSGDRPYGQAPPRASPLWALPLVGGCPYGRCPLLAIAPMSGSPCGWCFCPQVVFLRATCP
ncbi:hypothetical protein GW17_00048918 [Ensete ventricosum]|nr:hypothetical protein GW17_00048918 [Ensete ventricosum]